MLLSLPLSLPRSLPTSLPPPLLPSLLLPLQLAPSLKPPLWRRNSSCGEDMSLRDRSGSKVLVAVANR
jgi:hypothetical protein